MAQDGKTGIVCLPFASPSIPFHSTTDDYSSFFFLLRGIAKIGITDYAAHALGDVVYVELPAADLEVAAGEPIGAVESVKSASDVLSPVSGTVIQGNAVLEDKAKFINESPEGDAWIVEIEVKDPAELDGLLDLEAYKQKLNEEE